MSGKELVPGNPVSTEITYEDGQKVVTRTFGETYSPETRAIMNKSLGMAAAELQSALPKGVKVTPLARQEPMGAVDKRPEGYVSLGFFNNDKELLEALDNACAERAKDVTPK